MSNTTNLELPYLAVGQALKHVRVNETLRRLDAVVQLTVISASCTTLPGSPEDGAVYVVPAGKSGSEWSAFANWSLRYYRDGAWQQITPREGWLAYVWNTDQLLSCTGLNWSLFAPGKLQSLSAGDTLVGRLSSGAGRAEEITCTAAGRALLEAADAAAQLATLGTWRVLAACAVAASLTGTTTETPLATITLTGGAMGASGVSGRTLMNNGVSTTAANMHQRTYQNRNAQNAQVGSASVLGNSFGANANWPLTASENASVDHPIVLSGHLTNTGETVTLGSYVVEVAHRA